MRRRRRGPRRLWASYITAKRILANKKFIGELSPKAVSCSNKVFDNGNGTATVVNFPGEPDLELTFDCKLKFDQLIGADGREMSVSTGKVPAPDGVCYGIIRLASIKSSLQKSRQQKSSQKNGIKRKGIIWEGKGLDEIGKRADNGEIVIRIDPRYFRPTEVDELVGDPQKGFEKLGWCPEISLEDTIDEMIIEDKNRALEESLLIKEGFKKNPTYESPPNN